MRVHPIVAFLFASILSIPVAIAFSDISHSENETAIDALEDADIVEGYSDGTYRPENSINRAEFVKVLMEANYPGEAAGSNCFPDVSTDWYAKYVCTAQSLNIVEGYPDETFKPSNTINLAEALKVLLETYQIPTCESCYELWYEVYYTAAQDLDLLNGISRDPSHKLTRGEMAQLIYNLVLEENDEEEEKVEACEEQLFGFWGIIEEYETMAASTGMNAFVVASSPSYALNTQLPEVQDAELTGAFRMSGGNGVLIDSEGNFNLNAWKDLVDLWDDPSLDAFAGDELAWHMMLDDIDTFDNEFGGQNPTAAELAKMAEYSKDLFPEIKTFFRHDADDMPSGDYPYLDAVLNQYTASKGPLSDYISSNLEAAEDLDVDSMWGLNILDGGDGSSGEIGSSSNKYLMSPEEIEEYGEELLKTSGSLGLLMWKYDEHFSTDEYQQVFQRLATLANCEHT